MRICYFCGEAIEGLKEIRRDEVCPSCQNDLHCCLACKFYDEGYQNKCRESSAEWVSDREKNNFCEYFVWQPLTPSPKLRDREESRAKLEALFKKS